MQTNEQLIKSLEDAIQQAQETLKELKAKPQQLATTMDEVVEVLKPMWRNFENCYIDTTVRHQNNNVLTKSAAEKVQAYTDVLNLCAYLNGKFESEEGKYYFITNNFDIIYNSKHASINSIYHFTSLSAAEYALRHFKGVFEKFYQTI